MKAHAKSVKASDLVKGATYFMLSYTDEHFLIPIVETLIFLGRGLQGESDVKLYFQDAESYVHVGPFPQETSDDQELFTFPDHGLGSILELDEAIEELQRCLARKQRRAP